MAQVLPKLRTDLTVREQPTDKGTFFVVKDPITRNFFRFRETERFIAQQFDGATPIDTVRQRTEEKFQVAVSPESLAQFVNRLDETGLLESGAVARKRGRARRRRRIQGSFLYFRIRIGDPDRLFRRLVKSVRFLFTPHFVAASALLILLATAITCANWSDIRGGLPQLFQWSAIPLISLTVFLVIAAHEFAHGLTCKHFGGEVRELGFLLIYFQPALYTNVSDAWLFPEKAKRLWVGFAGPYFELFLWALAVLVWRLSDVEAAIHYVALVVMTTSGIKTLLNFNPLIKLDGYYLLSDYLEVPNLRGKAFSYLGGRIKRFFGSAEPDPEDLSQRERRIRLAYGLVAAVGSISILGYALANVGGYFIEQGQPLAFAAVTGLLGLKGRRRIRKFFGGASALSGPDEFGTPDRAPPAGGNGAGNEEAEPEADAEARRAEKRRKRKRRAWERRIKLLVFAGAIAPLLFLCNLELKIRGAFNVLPIHNAEVRTEVAGIVEALLVNEGAAVKAGDLIARLSARDTRAELRKTEADIERSRARLKLLEAGPTAPEIAVARAAVTTAEDRLPYARNRHAMNEALFVDRLISRKELEDTREQSVTASNTLAEAKSRLAYLLSGARPEELEATKAEIKRLETQRQFLEEQLQLLQVNSPIAGIVATPAIHLKEMKGQLVNKGDLIAKVYDYNTVTAEMVVSEKDIGDVKVGQSVLLKARAYPEVTFQGKVIAIATAAQANSSSTAQATSGITPATSRVNVTPKTVRVTTEIDNRSLLLKPEMTGQAKIYAGPRRIIDLVTRQAARTVKVEFWSWW